MSSLWAVLLKARLQVQGTNSSGSGFLALERLGARLSMLECACHTFGILKLVGVTWYSLEECLGQGLQVSFDLSTRNRLTSIRRNKTSTFRENVAKLCNLTAQELQR